MSEYKRELLMGGALAVALVMALGAIGNYLFPSPEEVSPTPTTTPAAPETLPGPRPPPPSPLSVRADVDSAKGFNFATKESQGFI